MGEILSAKCSSCDLHADELGVSEGGSFVFAFVWYQIHYCAPCEQLSTAPTLRPAEYLRARAPGFEGPYDMPQRLLCELAETIALAVERRCEHCNRKRKIVRWLPEERLNRCPRCKKNALALDVVGIWD